jgi:acetyl esterase/lipase
MKVLGMLVGALMAAATLHGQQNAVLPLWPAGKVPGALGDGTNDVPTLTVYLPEAGKANGSAMVICPGGGYGGLAQHEGRDYALFLNREGVACFVLKYRLGSHGYRHPAMVNDAARAVRLVRARSAEWRVDRERVGIMGSSAGGHLASTLVTHFDAGTADAADPVDRESSRPTLGILCYPVITMGTFTHQGSKRNLLGAEPAPALVEDLSNEKRVRKDGPPVFVWHTVEDTAVPVENALLFADGMRKAGVPFDLHVYEKGRHGIGLRAAPPAFENPHPWARDMVFWLKERAFLR